MDHRSRTRLVRMVHGRHTAEGEAEDWAEGIPLGTGRDSAEALQARRIARPEEVAAGGWTTRALSLETLGLCWLER